MRRCCGRVRPRCRPSRIFRARVLTARPLRCSGLKKGPPRRLKFPEADVVIGLVADALGEAVSQEDDKASDKASDSQ